MLKSEQDLRDIPAYTLAEAANYLNLPISTLRSWVVGRTDSNGQPSKPIIDLADKKYRRLSFINLVEAHVLNAIRRDHKIPLSRIRFALNYLKKTFHAKRPLVEKTFETNGIDLFVEEHDRLVNVSRVGQIEIRDLIKAYLSRVDRDEKGLPKKLYLFTRTRQANEPKTVAIDPQISFGRPILAGTGITTAVLVERYKAGDSIDDLVKDYGRNRQEIEEAIRCELRLAA